MEDEQKYSLALARIIGVAVTTTFLGFSGCTMHQTYEIGEMTKAGANPIAASCAISPQMARESVCAVVTATK